MMTRSARCARPINWTSTGVAAGTLSTCWPIVINPSAGFWAAAKGERNRIADCDPGRQAYVVIGPARARDQPINLFGQHTLALSTQIAGRR
jgi:hypothetical protein